MANTQTFSYTGAVQEWIVPAGVTEVTIECWGAEGGRVDSTTTRRYGGYAKGDTSVTPGETLRIYVGQMPPIGGTSGGWPNAGDGGKHTDNSFFDASGGGGSSDVRQGGDAFLDRIIVGAGAGGTSSRDDIADPPEGVYRGGHGGADTGERGEAQQFEGSSPGGGFGGSQSSGGDLGGDFGTGGDGGDGTTHMDFFVHVGSGGGGGGGYYGGGGGGRGVVFEPWPDFFDGTNGRGGGGGSNYVGGLSNTTTTRGVRQGHGQVVITWPDVAPLPDIEETYPSTIAGVQDAAVQLSDGSTVYLNIEQFGYTETAIETIPSGGYHVNTDFGNVYETKVPYVRFDSCTIDAQSSGAISVRLAKYPSGEVVGNSFVNISLGVQTISLDFIAEEPGTYIIYKEGDEGLHRTDISFDFAAHDNPIFNIITGKQLGGSDFDRYYYWYNLKASTVAASIERVTDVGSISQIDVLPTHPDETQALKLQHLYRQEIAMCCDDEDNLYFIGARGNSSTQTNVIAYTKTGPTTWERQGTRFLGTGSTVNDPVGHTVVWCDAGQGNGGKGRLLAAWASADTGEYYYSLVSAQEALTGSVLTVHELGTSPDWLVPSNSHINPRGVGINLATDLIGGTKVGAFSWSTDMVTHHTQMATITVGSAITDIQLDTSLSAFDLESHYRGKIVSYGTNAFIGAWNTIAGVTVKRLHTPGTQTLEIENIFDIAWDQQTSRLWIYYFRHPTESPFNVKLLRRNYNPQDNTLGDEIELQSLNSSTRTDIRTPDKIRNPSFVEVHFSNTFTLFF